MSTVIATRASEAYRTEILKEFPIAEHIRPFKHRILVHVVPKPGETVTEGGIIISARAREREIDASECALIVQVGHAVHESIQPGMWVALPPWAGTAVMHDAAGDTGANYRIIVEDAIMYFVDEEIVIQRYNLDRA